MKKLKGIFENTVLEHGEVRAQLTCPAGQWPSESPQSPSPAATQPTQPLRRAAVLPGLNRAGRNFTCGERKRCG